jgi:drug/metabolite transporter (DMT)-like permease
MGIFYAISALVAWAFDDFFIGRASKKASSVGALFILALLGTVTLLPAALLTEPRAYLHLNSTATLWTLGLLMVVTLAAALADFEALRVGKLAVVDPLYALEIPITIVVAFIVIGERLGVLELALVVAVVLGMILVSSKSTKDIAHIHWERGTKFALLSVVFMGGTNFLTAYAARLASPLFTNLVSYVGLLVCTGAYLLLSGRMRHTFRVFVSHLWLFLLLGLADIIAWTSFAKAAALLPIGLATAITESYIVLAVILGVALNKERIKRHQIFGIACTVAAVIFLAYIAS